MIDELRTNPVLFSDKCHPHTVVLPKLQPWGPCVALNAGVHLPSDRVLKHLQYGCLGKRVLPKNKINRLPQKGGMLKKARKGEHQSRKCGNQQISIGVLANMYLTFLTTLSPRPLFGQNCSSGLRVAPSVGVHLPRNSKLYSCKICLAGHPHNTTLN